MADPKVVARFAIAGAKDFYFTIDNVMESLCRRLDARRNRKLGQIACRHSHMTLGIVHGDPCPSCRAQI